MQLSLAEWLEPFGVTVAFLSGSTKGKARENLLERLAEVKLIYLSERMHLFNQMLSLKI